MLPQLMGLSGVEAEVDGFLTRAPTPTNAQIVAFLRLYDGPQRADAARLLIAKGVDPGDVSSALTLSSAMSPNRWTMIWGVLSVASMAASAYHGYRRNQSIGWALWWGLMGAVFPVLTPTIGVAQGFGRRKAV